MDNNSKKVSSVVCGMVFGSLIGNLVGRGIAAGVKKTPASIIPRLAILAVVEAGMLSSDKYAEWCYEVGDAFASKVRKGWYWLKYRDFRDLEKIPEDVFEEIYGK